MNVTQLVIIRVAPHIIIMSDSLLDYLIEMIKQIEKKVIE